MLDWNRIIKDLLPKDPKKSFTMGYELSRFIFSHLDEKAARNLPSSEKLFAGGEEKFFQNLRREMYKAKNFEIAPCCGKEVPLKELYSNFSLGSTCNECLKKRPK